MNDVAKKMMAIAGRLSSDQPTIVEYKRPDRPPLSEKNLYINWTVFGDFMRQIEDNSIWDPINMRELLELGYWGFLYGVQVVWLKKWCNEQPLSVDTGTCLAKCELCSDKCVSNYMVEFTDGIAFYNICAMCMEMPLLKKVTHPRKEVRWLL